jgi:hypothetical protein
MQCHSCDHVADDILGISKHASLKHSTPAIDTYIKLMCEGVRPTCACGCGENTKFYTVNIGFSKYAQGHHSRVHNNWGHNKEARERSHDARAASYARGEWQAWNKGLSTETDERLAAYGAKTSATLQSMPDERQRRAECMREARLDGRIPTLTGPAHSQWNGGTSALAAHCHGHTKLYQQWKYPKLLAANFACTRCGSNVRLEVHHCGERMAAIIKRFADQLGYDGTDATQHLKHRVAEAVAAYHVEADVPGTVLCAACHDLAHAALHT